MAILSPSAVREALAARPGWSRRQSVIRRTYQFRNFPKAIAFVQSLARAAEKACHHPDIDIRWNKVTLSLTTHDEGGLTEKDIAMASTCDRLSRRYLPTSAGK